MASLGPYKYDHCIEGGVLSDILEPMIFHAQTKDCRDYFYPHVIFIYNLLMNTNMDDTAQLSTFR